MTLSRFALSLINALFISAVLLAMMYSLIRSEQVGLNFHEPLMPIITVNVREDSAVVTGINKPKKPPLADPTPDTPSPTYEKPSGNIVNVISESLDYGSPEFGSTINDGQLNLAFAVPPHYPAKMASKGMQGYVVVGFSVSASGSVFDAYITEAEPSSGFNKAALNAIKRFKYKPRTIGGKPVATDGQFYRFVFEME